MKRSWFALALLSWAMSWAMAAGAADNPVLASQGTAGAIAPGQRFVSVAFHDVVDDRALLDGDAVTSDRLLAFFEHLRGNGWTAVSLDDVDAARTGRRPLPDKAILITFDDGYRSLYTRVFPLALAYRFPIVAALKSAWLTAPAGSLVMYGDLPVPREKFVTWDQVREMAASGLIEFASHSHALHHGALGNPQGNLMPAAVTRLYANGAYEDEAAFRRRILADLTASRDLLKQQTGVAPRAMVWPFGRYSEATVQAARDAGFRFALTLDPQPANAELPMALARYLPTGDPRLQEVDSYLRFTPRLPAAQRLVCLAPAAVWAGDADTSDQRLGQLIERHRKLGSTAVVIDAVTRGADGRLEAWFPNTHLPMRADLLSRLAWQLQTRAGVEVYLRLPVAEARAALGGDEPRVLALFAELGAKVAASGLFIEGAPGLVALPPDGSESAAMPWQLQTQRNALDPATLAPADALALRAYREVEKARPALKLALLAPQPLADAKLQPSAVADLTLFPAGHDAASVQRLTERFASQRPPGINAARRSGLWLDGAVPLSVAELGGSFRRWQLAGGTVLGWCPDDGLDDAPAAAVTAPDTSAATFPLRF